MRVLIVKEAGEKSYLIPLITKQIKELGVGVPIYLVSDDKYSYELVLGLGLDGLIEKKMLFIDELLDIEKFH